MNLFDDLGIPSRLVAYGVVQQVSSPGDLNEFPRLLAESLNATLAASTGYADALSAGLKESRIKTAQVARGSLNAYLSTPIKSDNEDVQRIIRDALEKYSEQALPVLKFGIRSAWSSRVVADSLIVNSRRSVSAVVRKMVSTGKHLLLASGFYKGKGIPNIFETDFLLDGAINLDLLEACLRKTSPSSLNVAGVQVNELYSVLSMIEISKQTAGLWESAFHPRPLEMNEADLIRETETLFGLLSKEFNLHQLSLWRSKFPTARGQNYSMRINMIPDQKLLLEIVKWFSSPNGGTMGRNLVDGGALIVREIMPKAESETPK